MSGRLPTIASLRTTTGDERVSNFTALACLDLGEASARFDGWCACGFREAPFEEVKGLALDVGNAQRRGVVAGWNHNRLRVTHLLLEEQAFFRRDHRIVTRNDEQDFLGVDIRRVN